MKNKSIKDKAYIAYIEQLPCHFCGHIPTGYRSIYSEYSDSYKKKPCKNNAHHVDTEMTRAKNDHRIIPACSHYTVSGSGTKDCHAKEHGNGDCKTQEHMEELVEVADKYYQDYCKEKEEKENQE